ncbi:hypothetical protein Cadr_000030123 [Camelus dromedarius]|uniref:Uncharacterized protein n=1 Tax=Camelus dromedarius TaxID=9838 RepID=A0A5N4C0N5_CAMDR|nr:hypothetical protein Cadr_000030123 [Camelus dromedarius]
MKGSTDLLLFIPCSLDFTGNVQIRGTGVNADRRLQGVLAGHAFPDTRELRQ